MGGGIWMDWEGYKAYTNTAWVVFGKGKNIKKIV